MFGPMFNQLVRSIHNSVKSQITRHSQQVPKRVIPQLIKPRGTPTFPKLGPKPGLPSFPVPSGQEIGHQFIHPGHAVLSEKVNELVEESKKHHEEHQEEGSAGSENSRLTMEELGIKSPYLQGLFKNIPTNKSR